MQTNDYHRLSVYDALNGQKTTLAEGPSIEHEVVSPTKAQRADEYIVVRGEVVLAGRM